MNMINKNIMKRVNSAFNSNGNIKSAKLSIYNYNASSLGKFQIWNKVDKLYSNNTNSNQYDKNKNMQSKFDHSMIYKNYSRSISFKMQVNKAKDVIKKSQKGLIEELKIIFDLKDISETYKNYRSGAKLKLFYNKYKGISLFYLPYGLLTFVLGANVLSVFGYLSYPYYFSNLINVLSFYSVFYTTQSMFNDTTNLDKDDLNEEPYNFNLHKREYISLISVFCLSSLAQISTSLFVVLFSYFGITLSTAIALNKFIPTIYKNNVLKPKHISKKCLLKLISLLLVAQFLGISIYCLFNFRKVEDHFNYDESLDSAIKVLQSSDKNFMSYYAKIEEKLSKSDISNAEASLN